MIFLFFTDRFSIPKYVKYESGKHCNNITVRDRRRINQSYSPASPLNISSNIYLYNTKSFTLSCSKKLTQNLASLGKSHSLFEYVLRLLLSSFLNFNALVLWTLGTSSPALFVLTLLLSTFLVQLISRKYAIIH